MIKWHFLIHHTFTLKSRLPTIATLHIFSCWQAVWTAVVHLKCYKGNPDLHLIFEPHSLTETVGSVLLCDFSHSLLLLCHINDSQLSFLSASSQHVISIKTSVTFEECQVMKISEQDIMPQTWGICVASSLNGDGFLECLPDKNKMFLLALAD